MTFQTEAIWCNLLITNNNHLMRLIQKPKSLNPTHPTMLSTSPQLFWAREPPNETSQTFNSLSSSNSWHR